MLFRSIEAQMERARQAAHTVFTPSSPVLDLRFLFGRESYLERIKKARRIRGKSVLLYGPPTSGKTSILKALEQQEDAFYCSAGRGHTWGLIIRSIFEKLDISENPEEVHRVTTEKKQAGVGIAGTGGHLAHESETRRIIRNPFATITPDHAAKELAGLDRVAIVDAFDKVKRGERIQFGELIKKLSDYQARLTLVLSGDAEKADDLIVNLGKDFERSDVRHLLEHIRVPPLSASDLEYIIDKGFSFCEIEIEPSAKDFILARSAGLPREVHRYCLDCVYVLESRIRDGVRDSLTIGTDECELADSRGDTG